MTERTKQYEIKIEFYSEVKPEKLLASLREWLTHRGATDLNCWIRKID